MIVYPLSRAEERWVRVLFAVAMLTALGTILLLFAASVG